MAFKGLKWFYDSVWFPGKAVTEHVLQMTSLSSPCVHNVDQNLPYLLEYSAQKCNGLKIFWLVSTKTLVWVIKNIEIQKVQQRAPKMAKEQEYLSYEKGLRELGPFSLKMKRLKGGVSSLSIPEGRTRWKQSQALSSGAQYQGRRQWTLTGTSQVALLCCAGEGALAQHAQRSWEVSSVEMSKIYLHIVLGTMLWVSLLK